MLCGTEFSDTYKQTQGTQSLTVEQEILSFPYKVPLY
jgi:hypothetical protein